ncbi:MAG: glutaredoxin family protein [Myxococcota bacterium]
MALLLLLSWTLTACDLITTQPSNAGDASDSPAAELLATLRKAKDNTANAVGNPGATSAADASATPTMDSIGPDSAKRVYYQFLDDRGGVQFVERLDAVPAAWRERVGYVEMDRPPPLTPAAARDSWKLSTTEKTELAFRTNRMRSAGTNKAGKPGKRRMDDFQSGQVVLYSATWCGYCTKARKHLDRAGVEYEIRDVDNGGVARELKAKTGRGGVPVLDFEGEILRGYSAGQYDKVIRAIKG